MSPYIRTSKSRWRAKEILTRIAAVHANFYPKPVTPDQIDEKWRMEEVSTNFLTRNDFETLYDKCGEMLHFWNPFRAGPRVVDFGRSLNEWRDLIENLLRRHIVWTHSGTEPRVCMDGAPEAGEGWLVYLSRPEDGKMHALRFEPSPSEPATFDDAGVARDAETFSSTRV